MAQEKKWFYKSYWMQDRKVAYFEIIGDFDEEGMTAFNEHMRDDYIALGEAPVHCIIDAGGLTGYPRSVAVIGKNTSKVLKHPNLGWIILVGFDNPIVKFMANMVVQILRVQYKQVKTLKEAKELLLRIDPELADFA